MFFYTKFLEKKSEYSKISLSFTKKINKVDKKLFKLLYSGYNSAKKEYIILNVEQILKLYKLNSMEDLTICLNKVIKPLLEYRLYSQNGNCINGSFPIVSSFFIEESNIIFFLSKEVLLSFESNNFFNYIDIFEILGFENNYSIIIFLEIINLIDLKEQGELIFLIKDFKKLLKVENLYDRFYDLERKVIKSIISDFNNNSRYKINIEKIKDGVAHSSKLVGIKIIYTNKILEIFRMNVNELMAKMKDIIIDYNFVYDLILDNLKLQSYDYTKANINYAIKNCKKENFDNYLAKALKNDYYSLHKETESHKEIITEVSIHSTYNLYNEISNILTRTGLREITEDANFHSLFYRTVYNLIDKKVYTLEYNYNSLLIKITVQYYESYKTIITINKISSIL